MDREGFKNRLKQYKKAREENPGLKYWEWKGIPKYDEGTGGVTLKEKEDAFWRGDTAKMAELVEREGGKLTYVTPESNLDEVVVTAKNLKKEKQLKEDYNNFLDLGTTVAGFVPGLGEVIDAVDVVNQLRQGNYGDASLVGLGLMLPFISGRVLKKGGKYLSDAYRKLYPTLGEPEVSKIHTTPVYHSTRFALPEDLPVAGSELGFHVGTPKAAKERFRKTAGMEKNYPDRITFPHMEEGYIQLIEDKIADVDDLVLFHPSMFEQYNSPGTFYTRDKRIINALKDPIYMDDLLDEVEPFRKNLILNYGVDALRYINGAEDAGSVSYAVLNPNIIKLAKQVQHQYPTHDYLFTNNDKIYPFAEGGEVTGPPTYEQWNADMNQYNPTILDNASTYWSIEAAKKALHNEAMGLPGYAPMWNNYVRSLPKVDPDINQFVDDLWANENPNNVGYRNGKYYPHKSPEGGKMTIGPGFKLDSGSHGISTKTANRGMTKTRLDQEARKIGKQHLKAVDQFINYGQTTNPADTISPQIKMGLMDLRHQVGPLNEWGNLRQAVLNGDLEGIRKESTVTWNDNGKTKVDKRRKKIRDEKYFYYE